MKILIALPYTPYPVERGTGRLIINLIDGLSTRHDVILSTMTLSMEGLKRLEEIRSPSVKIAAMVAPHRRSLFHRIFYKLKYIYCSVFRSIPTEVSYAAPGPFLRLISEIAEAENVDLVIANYWHLFKLPNLLPGRRVALLTHDLDYLVSREKGGAGRPGQKLSREVRMREKIEKLAYREYPAIITVTKKDADTLKRMPDLEGKTIIDLPVSMDLDEFSPVFHDRLDSTLLFMGHLASDFNEDALRYLLDDIFPIILRKCPETILRVVGDGVPDDILGRKYDNVVFAGHVRDIRKELGECTVMILPLRFAGGIRIRMLEAAAMGVAVVSTGEGVSGIELTEGREYHQGDSPEEIAEKTCSLLLDKNLVMLTGKNARAWAEQHISGETSPDRLETMIAELSGAAEKVLE
jgi:glycosyltransferase involved in cell wall biosynthesis